MAGSTRDVSVDELMLPLGNALLAFVGGDWRPREEELRSWAASLAADIVPLTGL